MRGRFVSGRHETFEGLAGLIDALGCRFTDFGGDFVWYLRHDLRPSLAKLRGSLAERIAGEPSLYWRYFID
jgi:hypothetical protein